PRQVIGILLSLVGVAVNIDSVFYFNMGRVDFTGFILGAGGIGSYAPLLSWSGNDIFAHRFISPAIKSNFINDGRFFKAISAKGSSLLDARRLTGLFSRSSRVIRGIVNDMGPMGRKNDSSSWCSFAVWKAKIIMVHARGYLHYFVDLFNNLRR